MTSSRRVACSLCRARCACLTGSWPISASQQAIERHAQRALQGGEYLAPRNAAVAFLGELAKPRGDEPDVVDGFERNADAWWSLIDLVKQLAGVAAFSRGGRCGERKTQLTFVKNVPQLTLAAFDGHGINERELFTCRPQSDERAEQPFEALNGIPQHAGAFVVQDCSRFLHLDLQLL